VSIESEKMSDGEAAYPEKSRRIISAFAPMIAPAIAVNPREASASASSPWRRPSRVSHA